MQWRFYFAACFLTAALLGPHAPVVPMLSGMGIAGLLCLVWRTVETRGRRGP